VTTEMATGAPPTVDGRWKILVVNSETEAWSMYPVRQPDSATYRFWEIAGGAHGGNRMMEDLPPVLGRDDVTSPARST
jgi:hypothetical protein